MHMHERSVKLSQVGTEVLLLMSVPTTDLKLKFLSVCHVTGWTLNARTRSMLASATDLNYASTSFCSQLLQLTSIYIHR
jgi:hypothetical protein